jgi:hypothetical protein
MTIARDIRTGAVVGQPVPDPGRATTYDGKRWVMRLLVRDGRYVTVPASSVRLEELR